MGRQSKTKGLTARGIGSMYHPDSVQHILNAQKERGPLTLQDAEKLDQEWAASRMAEFNKGHRAGRDMIAHIMQEAPNSNTPPNRTRDARRKIETIAQDPNSELKVTEPDAVKYKYSGNQVFADGGPSLGRQS